MAYNNKVDYTKDNAYKGQQTKINPPVEQINIGASRASNSPVDHIRVAGGICVAVWENKYINKETGIENNKISYTLEKSYKDKEGAWQKTGTLSTNDIPRVIVALDEAYRRAVLKGLDPES
jgi:hypothetical protein